MELIDKSALVAEIEKRINDWTIRGKNSLIGQGKDTCESRVTELNDLLSFLNTLEVKEVDLIKIKGYVARDNDDSLWFHYTKPHRENDIEKTWWGSNDRAFQINDFDFPEYADLTWEESEPVEVELTLKRLSVGE